ncbi:MAG TPA: heavy-metal-associated domain-containing protein [Mycobacteriales bacterium]|nr:heavy-metal-associated domain-containing protein [Mycobacteriales bacterium]
MRDQMPRTFVGTTAFSVIGMTCEHCRIAIIDAIGRIPGVEGVEVDLESGAATVTAETPVDRADIAAAVRNAGHTFHF